MAYKDGERKWFMNAAVVTVSRIIQHTAQELVRGMERGQEQLQFASVSLISPY